MHKHMVDIVTNYFIFWKQFCSVSELNQFIYLFMYLFNCVYLNLILYFMYYIFL